MGRKFMEAYGLTLHWDFGHNNAYLETPDK